MDRAEPSLLPPDHDATGAWPPGHRIGNFELQQVLPRTGSARIYRAWDHALARPVAVKEYQPAELVQRDERGRLRAAGAAAAALFERGRHIFLDEARRLARCDHPALARVLQLVEADGTAYCVMPWYAGRPLMEVPLALGGPLPEAELRVWLGDLLGALEAWHEVGGFHGGVHPGKALLLDDGHGLLLAPGAAARITETGDARTAPGANFRPDEQLYPGDHQAPGPWTDFHSLAAVARYAMTGQLPPPPGHGPAEPLAATLERLFWNEPSVRYSPELLRALDAAMSPDIARRPQTAGQFRRWLRDLHDTVLAPLSERPAAAVQREAREPFAHSAPGRLDAVQPPPQARRATLVEVAARLAQAEPLREPVPVQPSVAPQPWAASPPMPNLSPEQWADAPWTDEPAAWGDAAQPAGPMAAAPEPATAAVEVEVDVDVVTPQPAPSASLQLDTPAQQPDADPTAAVAPATIPEPAAPVATADPAAPPEASAATAAARPPAPAAPAPAPAAASAAAAHKLPDSATDEEVDAATAALIRQLLDDIPDAPPPPPRRPRRGARPAPAAAAAEGAPPEASAAAGDPDPSLQFDGPQPDDPPPRPRLPDLRARLRDPRLAWGLAAAVALFVAGVTAWQLRPRPGLNVTGDDLPALALPGPAAAPLARGPAPVELQPAAPPLPATAAGPRGDGGAARGAAPATARESGPRQQCGTRTEFALYRCMQQMCGQARWARHAQCLTFRRTDSVE